MHILVSDKNKGIMEDMRMTIGYVFWIVIVALTLGLFSYFSKKYKNLGSLLFFVLVPTWAIVAIMKGLEVSYYDSSKDLEFLKGFGLLLADTLPMLIVVGGITFTLRYLKFRKKGR